MMGGGMGGYGGYGGMGGFGRPMGGMGGGLGPGPVSYTHLTLPTKA